MPADPAASSQRSRSLADDLRGRPDSEIIELLTRRPDLAVPPPADLTALATRAAGRASVRRALDTLNTAALQVLEVLAVAPEPAAVEQVRRLWGADPSEALADLRRVALVWGPDDELRLIRAAAELLGGHPAGLGPPLAEALTRRSPRRLAELCTDLGLPEQPPGGPVAALTEFLSEPDRVRALVDQAPPGAKAVLDRLTWGPPVGQVAEADRPVRSATATTPVEWLLAHGLLAVTDPGHVVLPREVGLALRDGRVHPEPSADPPPLQPTEVSAKRVEHAQAAAAAEAVRLAEALSDLWGEAPPAMLRTGGIGVRDLRRTAAALGIAEEDAALLIEAARAAGLLGDDHEADPCWAPTVDADDWLTDTTGQRWARLAGGWLATAAAPSLVGTRDERQAVRSALSAAIERPGLPGLRAEVLALLASAGQPAEGAPVNEAPVDRAPERPPGRRVPAVGADQVLARLDWGSPRRAGRGREELVRAILREAGWLGVTGAGALTPAGRLLLAGDPDGAAAAIDASLPTPVDHVLLQADLTAVAPGPLEPEAARELAMAADVESRGGATVYRFTPESVRRALDAGWTGAEVLALLARRSRTPIPQPLEYLVTDTARRHGRVRVGVAAAYLRAEDESLIAQILADKRTTGLGLRRLAPTVVAASAPAEEVLEVLRAIGVAPAAESDAGELLLTRPRSHRAPRAVPGPRGLREPARAAGFLGQAAAGPPELSARALAELTRALRAAEEAGRPRAATAARAVQPAPPPGELPTQPADPAVLLAQLRAAVADRRQLWLGTVDAAGQPTRRLVEPLSVAGGRVTVLDRATGEVRALPIHRVQFLATG